MNMFKKAAIAFAATSMVAAPVAASAAQGSGMARAVSTMGDENSLEGNSTWIVIGVLAVAIVAAIVVLSDDDSPTSP